MINTYQTSLAPPPVPPRHSRPHSVLIPAPHPSLGRGKPLINLLVTLVLLELLLSVGGFVYLYYNGNTGKLSPEAKAAYLSVEKERTSRRILARMVVQKRLHTETSTSKYLQWDIRHSFRRDISYYHNVWLTVQQSGDYYVYARVTFSKGSPSIPLASKVMVRKNETDKAEETVMQAYCSLIDNGAQIPHLCTATQGEVVPLESGNQLSVWVEDPTLVSYEEGATTFGMYKL